MPRAIGIDLGTTYTVVATIEGERPTVLPNAEGQRLTPSVVAFPDGGRPLVGEPARRQAAANPDSTVFSIKRRMGSDLPVRIDGKEYAPQEISSLILQKVKADAEKHLGERIDRAVITVPAYFNDRQRQATREAGALAGLEVLGIVNEPTAAALAYGLEREDVHTVLVWDLGGGTFDVSVLELGEGIFEVRAVSGDTWLGGDDVDQRVADCLAAQYQRLSGAAFPADAGPRQRLREVAERAKIQLSSAPVARVRIPAPRPASGRPRHIAVELSREQLEGLVADLLQRMEGCARQALADAGLAPSDIDRVLLVGGATRMPAVRDRVRRLMGKEPYRSIDPDEVVAMGAALYAGTLLGLVERVTLLDVLPLSLGVETQGGLMARIIPRNTPLPAAAARIFTTAADGQPSMDIHVLQGERGLAAENISLRRFQLTGIPLALRGVPRVEVAFEADVDGIAHVSARDLLTESEVTVKVAPARALDAREVDLLAREARRHAARDRHERERIEAALQAQNVMAAVEMALSEIAGTGPSEVEREGADSQARQLGWALAQLQESLARGTTAEVKARCEGLRRLLAAVSRDRRRAAQPVAHGQLQP